MMKMINTPKGDILVLNVPSKSYRFEIVNTYRKELRFRYDASTDPMYQQEKVGIDHIDGVKPTDCISILGKVNKKGCLTFDPTELCEKRKMGVCYDYYFTELLKENGLDINNLQDNESYLVLLRIV